MRAILHLGTEKTGTSTIQAFLNKNRDVLYKKGFYIMKCTQVGAMGDRKLSAYSLLEDEYDDYHKNELIDSMEGKRKFEASLEEAFESEIKTIPESIHTVILSSEHFHSRVKNDGNKIKLKKLLDKFFIDYDLIVYLRQQVSLAVSHYTTYLRGGGEATLNEYMDLCNPSNHYYNYYPMLDSWEMVFKPNSFFVKVFNSDELIDKDITHDFLSTLNIELSDFDKIKKTNESVNCTGQEILRNFNKIMPTFIKGVGHNKSKDKLVEIIVDLFSGDGQSPDPIKAIEIQEKFSESNKKVKNRWLPDRECLFKPSSFKIKSNEVKENNVVSCFTDFFERYSMLSKAELVGVSSKSVNSLRDAALRLEYVDLNMAYSLMLLAKLFRPEGPLINKKIEDYSILLKNDNNERGFHNEIIEKIRDTAIFFEKTDISISIALMRVAYFMRPEGALINKKIKEYERLNDLGLNAEKKSLKFDRKYYLSNACRVNSYFDKGIFSSEKDEPLTEKWPGPDYPFLFNDSSMGMFNKTLNKSRVSDDYFKDTQYFYDVVGCQEKIPVQFGDGELRDDVVPSGIVFKKARAIGGKGIIFNINKSRHWGFSRDFDKLVWLEKKPKIIWRGAPTGIKNKEGYKLGGNVRFDFIKKYYSKFDVGFSRLGQQGDSSCEPYIKGFVEVDRQLENKYIISLEGNDVATGLKWILASNSVPIMPKPTCESWLLESQLLPYVHYVPLSDSLDNLDEVYEWCLNNDDHCRQIAENGKRYMEMFFDEENEKEIYRMIYERYKNFVS